MPKIKGMGYISFNKNPCHKRTIDCSVRALSTLLDRSWGDVYFDLCLLGYTMCDMPLSKAVINEYLSDLGYIKEVIPNTCPTCYTVKDFTHDYPYGRYLLACDSHVIPVIDGDYIDTFDSGEEIPLFYWKKER